MIVAANKWGWDYVLSENNKWYLQRIDEKNIKKIKFIAFYQTAPLYSINYYAKVKKIIYNREESHYDVFLTGKPISIKSIKLDSDKRHLAPQGFKYTLLSRLIKARKLSDLINK